MTKWTNEQLDAINKSGTNIIVSAGAGSGKTAVLTERVINKLNNGIHINELLILTFTNNAAAEMKERIKKRISKIPELKEELNLIESANITTFDAYVLSLVKKYHYYLDIDQNINIIDSTIVKQKKKEIINNIFNNLYENNNSQFINLITKYGVKNDKEIKRLILNIDDTLDLIIDKDYYLNNYINSYYSNDNLNNLFNEYNNILSKRIDSIKSSLYNLSFESDSDYFNKINDLLLPLLNAKNYGEIRSSLDISLPRLPNKSSDIVKYFKEQIKNLIDSLKVDTSFTKEYLINEVISTKEDAEVIILLLSELNKETNSYKLSHKIYEFNDISKLAIKLLKNNKDVCNDLKMSFKEIMIDEYQDTSDMQEEFIKLIENNNVYMVGDVKQSIYRFRNANPDIFKLKYDFYKNNNGGIKIDLNKNFRSRANVLASINDIFNHIMDNDIGNANYKDEHQLIYGNLAFDEKGANNYNNNLEINTYEEDDIHSNEEIEAFIIANDINNKINNKYLVFDNEQLRPATYKDFCILMDRTNNF
jgi:ATP-dependent helicase/nuclease subunit A